MRKPRFAWLVGLIAVFALVGAACATHEEGGGSGGTGGGTETLLDQIKADGTLKVSTDPKYPP
jgi:ABC-type amino acid transport substrate-binding protein